ncbi:MAG: sialate O-acetylesterase, partial [Bacteroidales bacterium]
MKVFNVFNAIRKGSGILFVFLAFCILTKAQSTVTTDTFKLKKGKLWVFILAGQSNMAGRGKLEAQDSLTSSRIFSINEKGEIISAKEPLHFYEPKMKGVGCGLAFGKELLNHIPNDVSILLIPTAVGGSSINQWLKNSTHRGVPLLANFKEKVEIGKRFGEVKAILWHQGESDVKPDGITNRQEKMKLLFTEFRNSVGNPSLPILIGELGSFLKDSAYRVQMNEQIRLYSKSDTNTSIISTSDFNHIGDHLHFNAAGQREMGKRFAIAYIHKSTVTTQSDTVFVAQYKSDKQCAISYTFDDGLLEHYSLVFPKLEKLGFKATFWVNGKTIEDCEKGIPTDKPRVSWQDLKIMAAHGHEISNHGWSHKNLVKFPLEEGRIDIERNDSAIEANIGERPVTYCYPNNSKTPEAVQMASINRVGTRTKQFSVGSKS